MEVYTGAGVSIAPESVLKYLLPSVELKKTNVVLKAYTGQPIPVKGSIAVNVDYGQQHYKNVKLLVVRGSGPSLMGQDWLKVIQLNWLTIGRMSMFDGHVAALQDKYQEVFLDTLGMITPFQAKLSV